MSRGAVKPVYRGRQEGILARELDDETVLLDTTTDRIHQLNQTASFVWRECGSPTTAERIAAAMVREFDVSEDTALRDVTRVLAQLRALNLVIDAHQD